MHNKDLTLAALIRARRTLAFFVGSTLLGPGLTLVVELELPAVATPLQLVVATSVIVAPLMSSSLLILMSGISDLVDAIESVQDGFLGTPF